MSKEKFDEITELSDDIYNSFQHIARSDSRNIAESLYNDGWRKQSEWISVEERLPDLYGTYLVYTYDNRIKLGYFCELVIGLPPEFDDYAVTHWMPLPEPPKGE